MIVLQKDVLSITREQDTIFLRNRLKEIAIRTGMGLVNQTKLITAASELVRNMLRYAEGGKVTIHVVGEMTKNGIRMIFEDKGPGIDNIQLAMKEGYSTEKSLGLGLPGARKLVDEFHLQSTPGEGTTITILKWK